jgi:hypothetical protein
VGILVAIVGCVVAGVVEVVDVMKVVVVFVASGSVAVEILDGWMNVAEVMVVGIVVVIVGCSVVDVVEDVVGIDAFVSVAVGEVLGG